MTSKKHGKRDRRIDAGPFRSTGHAAKAVRVLFFTLCVMWPGVAQSQTRCIGPPYSADTTEDQQRLAALYRHVAPALDRFPSLAEALRNTAPELCLARHMDSAHGYLALSPYRIVISRTLPHDMQVGVLLHEFRHLEQFARGVCPSDDLAVGDYVSAVFAMEADASAISLLMAWDMKERGHPGAWQALSRWPLQADIARRFAAGMASTGDTAQAVSAAFAQWYALPERRNRYYIAVCGDFLDRQDATHALPSYRAISGSFYTRLCRLPDGRPYSCIVPETDLRGD